MRLSAVALSLIPNIHGGYHGSWYIHQSFRFGSFEDLTLCMKEPECLSHDENVVSMVNPNK